MKKIIVILFLFAAVTVSAQNIPDDDTTSKPAITAIGKPDGEKAEMKIGKDGGSFSSADGKIKLIIPEGAVSKKTTFSIQPVTNLMPNGNGKAYRLEPSGIEFQKPVELVFHYDAEEPEDSTELQMGIAMQDDKGEWYGLNEVSVDTVAKTISGNINHFSTWAPFDYLKIEATERLKVRRPQHVDFVGINIDWNDMPPELENQIRGIMLRRLRIWRPPHTLIWRVNGIEKGNAVVGTLTTGRVNENLAKYGNLYIAPDNVPDQNPVTISVELEGAIFKRGKGKTLINPRVKTKILIYDDAYEVTITSRLEGDGGSVGTVVYEDWGSFVVELNGTKSKIIEKFNKNMTSAVAYKGGHCVFKTKVPGYGNIHIKGVPNVIVIPAKPDKPARVIIIFARIPTEVPILGYTCTDLNGKIHTGNTATGTTKMRMMPALPTEIRFDAKEGEQVLHEMDMGGISFKVTVRPLER